VTNTTPLITLAGIGLLDLLPRLYDEVWAPRIVLDEYSARAPLILATL
jgi:predicted nucleic acid-binding protein